jgi:hypothetical protein
VSGAAGRGTAIKLGPVAFLRKTRPDADSAVVALADEPAQSVLTGPKGRPTPKRRDSVKRPAGPVPKAPTNRKEAVAWQKQQRASARTAPKMDKGEYRAAMRAGDDRVLTARDRGPVKSLARDYVDSRRMLSNYLFGLLPLVLISTALPRLQILSLLSMVMLVVITLESVLTGRKVRALALQRFGTVKERAGGLGFYCASRASMPRRWRLPEPKVSMGDAV